MVVGQMPMHRLFAIMLIATSGLCACSSSQPAPGQPVFCYRTLADIGCYLEPDRGREGRITGIWLRPPAPESQPSRH
jgi:hypothetical protein